MGAIKKVDIACPKLVFDHSFYKENPLSMMYHLRYRSTLDYSIIGFRNALDKPAI